MTKFLHNVIQRIRSRREGRTRTTYDLRFDDVGLTVRRLTMENETGEESFRWDDVAAAKVFKRDLFSVDCICLAFQKTDGTWFEINEECKGWRDLLPSPGSWTDARLRINGSRRSRFPRSSRTRR